MAFFSDRLLGERDLCALLPVTLSIAAINGPALCAVSGPTTEIDAFAARLGGQGIHAQTIHAAAAFHSAMMEPVLGKFREEVGCVALGAPAIPYVSNVTGTWITVEEATDPSYWARHVRGSSRQGCTSYEVKVLCRQLPDSDGKHIRGVGR